MRRLKKVIVISSVGVVLMAFTVDIIISLVFASNMPHEMTIKRILESKGLLPFMIAGARRNAAGISPAFSESDMKRFQGTGINYVDNIFSANHVVGLAFHISAGPEDDCSILIFTDGERPLPGLNYYDYWGNGIWWHQSWPFWMPYIGETKNDGGRVTYFYHI